jgi:penicillin-binding protein 1B
LNLKALQSDVAYLPPGRRQRILIFTLCGAVVALGLSAFTVVAVHLWAVTSAFPQAPYHQPSRLYGRPHRLVRGEVLSSPELAAELVLADYRDEGAAPGGTGAPGAPGALKTPGAFRAGPDHLAVQLRRFYTPEGTAGGAPLGVFFHAGRIARLTLAGREVADAELEPPLLASFYGPKLAECRPVTLAEIPPEVVQAVLAVEDHDFYRHAGVSLSATARALWADLRSGHAHQGGSTITQQLVKNLYLSPRRTLARKAEEAMLATFVELRRTKRAILESYLNEIYWGRRGPLHLRGLGAAAWSYFGKEPAALTLEEGATLAGMIRSPAEYSPVEHPAAARGRRDLVLRRLARLGWIDAERARRAMAEPLAVAASVLPASHQPEPAFRPNAPYFADAAAAEARSRFGIRDLDDGGYLLFSSLDLAAQRQAEEAVGQGVAALERVERAGKRGGQDSRESLEAALVSVDPNDGAILAYVGGRDYRRSQFDRVAQAHRQLGSAFKPVIYASAFSAEVATPATLLDDDPIVVRNGEEVWTPQNYDRTYRGWVTTRAALEQSLNIPTVRLAFQAGLQRVAALARNLGLTGKLDVVPALALGAVEATPRELAQVYATFAAGGRRPPIHGLEAVLDRSGHAVFADLPLPARVLRPQCAYLVNSILQGALDHGTGSGARRLGIAGPLAGKTGTTNDRRDNWFAGYSPDRVTIVWVGYDDDAGTRLSGATGAVPVWSRFTRAMRPAAGYADFPRPPGLVRVTLDPETGELATPFCSRQVTELLPEWQVPTSSCHLHAPVLAAAPFAGASGNQGLVTGAVEIQSVRDTPNGPSVILIRPARARQAAAAASAAAEDPPGRE